MDEYNRKNARIRILAILVNLLEDQENVKITYELKKGDKT